MKPFQAGSRFFAVLELSTATAFFAAAFSCAVFAATGRFDETRTFLGADFGDAAA